MNIIIAALPGPKPWSWKTLETRWDTRVPGLRGDNPSNPDLKLIAQDGPDAQPLGGSESAVIGLAEALAKLDHRVVVESGWDEPEPSPANVKYMNVQAADAPRTADLVIVSRAQPWLQAFNAPVKLFWSHDLMNFETAPRTPEDCTAIIALSRYHAQCFPKQRIIIMPNGIDPAYFQDIPFGNLADRQAGKLAYTSNFDRGLPVAIDILHQWRAQYPHLELHVYGGMAVYGWGDQRQRLYVPENTEGVVFHGALPKAELAKELGTCWAWFYPTFWPETFCIAALEAQAAGVPCITVPVGALPETVASQPPSYDLETTLTNLMHDPTWVGASKKAAYFGRDLTWTSAAEGLLNAIAGH